MGFRGPINQPSLRAPITRAGRPARPCQPADPTLPHPSGGLSWKHPEGPHPEMERWRTSLSSDPDGLRAILRAHPMTRPATLSLVIFWWIAATATGATTRPNVLVIITDDQGHGDLGAHGNPVIRTPNLDRFTRESVKLD